MYQRFYTFLLVILLASCSPSTQAPPPTNTPIQSIPTKTPIQSTPTRILPTETPGPPPLAQWAGSMDNMVLIPEGCYRMGWAPLLNIDWPAGDLADDETPVHEVCLDAFYIDKYEETNSQFMEFVHSTGYVTTAEKIGMIGMTPPTF